MVGATSIEDCAVLSERSVLWSVSMMLGYYVDHRCGFRRRRVADLVVEGPQLPDRTSAGLLDWLPAFIVVILACTCSA